MKAALAALALLPMVSAQTSGLSPCALGNTTLDDFSNLVIGYASNTVLDHRRCVKLTYENTIPVITLMETEYSLNDGTDSRVACDQADEYKVHIQKTDAGLESSGSGIKVTMNDSPVTIGGVEYDSLLKYIDTNNDNDPATLTRLEAGLLYDHQSWEYDLDGDGAVDDGGAATQLKALGFRWTVGDVEKYINLLTYSTQAATAFEGQPFAGATSRMGMVTTETPSTVCDAGGDDDDDDASACSDLEGDRAEYQKLGCCDC